MKTKALDLRIVFVAPMLILGGVLFARMPQAVAEEASGRNELVRFVQNKAALSEVELMLMVHRPELPRAEGAGTAR